MTICTLSWNGSSFTGPTCTVSDTTLTFVLPDGWSFGSNAPSPRSAEFSQPQSGDPVAFRPLNGSRSPGSEFSNWARGSFTVSVSSNQSYNFMVYVGNKTQGFAWYTVFRTSNGTALDTDEDEIVVNNT